MADTLDVESLRHLLAGLAARPVLLVARTLSHLLGMHETFSAFRLGAQILLQGRSL